LHSADDTATEWLKIIQIVNALDNNNHKQTHITQVWQPWSWVGSLTLLPCSLRHRLSQDVSDDGFHTTIVPRVIKPTASHSQQTHFTAITQDNLRQPAPQLKIGGFC